MEALDALYELLSYGAPDDSAALGCLAELDVAEIVSSQNADDQLANASDASSDAVYALQLGLLHCIRRFEGSIDVYVTCMELLQDSYAAANQAGLINTTVRGKELEKELGDRILILDVSFLKEQTIMAIAMLDLLAVLLRKKVLEPSSYFIGEKFLLLVCDITSGLMEDTDALKSCLSIIDALIGCYASDAIAVRSQHIASVLLTISDKHGSSSFGLITQCCVISGSLLKLRTWEAGFDEPADMLVSVLLAGLFYLSFDLKEVNSILNSLTDMLDTFPESCGASVLRWGASHADNAPNIFAFFQDLIVLSIDKRAKEPSYEPFIVKQIIHFVHVFLLNYSSIMSTSAQSAYERDVLVSAALELLQEHLYRSVAAVAGSLPAEAFALCKSEYIACLKIVKDVVQTEAEEEVESGSSSELVYSDDDNASAISSRPPASESAKTVFEHLDQGLSQDSPKSEASQHIIINDVSVGASPGIAEGGKAEFNALQVEVLDDTRTENLIASDIPVDKRSPEHPSKATSSPLRESEENKALLDSIDFLIQLNKRSQQQAMRAMKQEEITQQLFQMTMSRLQDLEGSDTQHERRVVPAQPSSPAESVGEQTIASKTTMEALGGILHGFKYHVLQNIGAANKILGNNMAFSALNKDELLEKNYNEYMDSTNSLSMAAVEELAESVADLFSRFKSKLTGQPSDLYGPLTVGELRYAMRYVGLLDGRTVKNNDLDIMLLYLNAKKVTLQVFAFVFVVCVVRSLRHQASALDAMTRMAEIVTQYSHTISSATASCIWQSPERSPSESQRLQGSLDADAVDAIRRETVALHEIFQAYLPKVPRVASRSAPSSSGAGLLFDGFLLFAKDFEIYPQLANKADLKSFWSEIAGREALSFSQFQNLVCLVGVRCAVLAEASSSTPLEKVRRLLLWLHTSKGRERVAERCRGRQIPSFRIQKQNRKASGAKGARGLQYN